MVVWFSTVLGSELAEKAVFKGSKSKWVTIQVTISASGSRFGGLRVQVLDCRLVPDI